MRKIFMIAVLVVSIGVTACAEKKVEPENKSESKKNEMKVHGGGSSKEPNTSGFKDVVKKQTLPGYPAMTVGKAFDDYSHLVKKEWKETRAPNGTMYIDFSGWLEGNSLGIDAIKKGLSRQGVEVKFVISRDGVFFVGMASKLEATTDGKVNVYPLSDVKAILDSIYANREITF